jgi:hypothetical protein
MLDNYQWWLVGSGFVAFLACLGLAALLSLAACVWKPEHVYAGLLRVRRIFVGREVTPSGWRSV